MTADQQRAGSGSAPAQLSARQVQGVRSRVEILDAAEELMGRLGYTATSIAAVSKESGLPASSIYWHFESKSGLLGAVMERGSQRFFADVTSDRLRTVEAPRDRLELLLKVSVENIRAHPQFLRLFVVLLLGAEGQHAQHAVVERVRRQGARLMTEGIELVYEQWGPDLSARIARELGPVALAIFDGLFIAAEADEAFYDVLVGHSIDALHMLAEELRRSSL